MLDLAVDADDGRGQLGAAIGHLHRHRDFGFHATELLQKVDVEVGASKLAIGDAFEPHVLLKLHDLGNGLVFHFAQGFGTELALGMLLAGFEQIGGAQKAAHVVVAGGKMRHGHERLQVSGGGRQPDAGVD